MQVARQLKIEGLLNTEHTNEDDKIQDKYYIDVKKEESKLSKRKETVQSTSLHEPLENIIDSLIKEDPEILTKLNKSASLVSDEAEQRIAEIIKKIDGHWECNICGAVKKTKQHITNHAETHIEGLSYACSMCSKSYRSKNVLFNHISLSHRQ